MKKITIFSVLMASGFLSSCDFSDDCDYFGWLRVENNWQGYTDIPASPDLNYALFYSDSKGFQGEQKIQPNLQGIPDAVTLRMPMGTAKVITYTKPNEQNENSSLSKNIKFSNLENYAEAIAYVDYNQDDFGYKIAEPGLFYIGQADVDVKFEDTEVVKESDTQNLVPVLQKQVTRFLEFRFHIGKDNPSLPNVTGIRTQLSGIATQIRLSTGEGVPESAVTCDYRATAVPKPGEPGYDADNPSSENLADIQFKYSFSALDFLGRFDDYDNTSNILTIYATLDNGEERMTSIDISPYLTYMEEPCMVARINVDVSSDNLKLGVDFADYEAGLWEYYNIGK